MIFIVDKFNKTKTKKTNDNNNHKYSYIFTSIDKVNFKNNKKNK